MSQSHNEITLVGRLSDNSQFATTKSGHRVGNLNLVTSERYKNKQGETIETASWHKLQVWRKAAEFAENNLGKGDMLLVVGKLKYNQYEKDGQKHIEAYIEVSKFNVLVYKNSDKPTAVTEEDLVSELPDGAGASDDLPF
jgi:single-strand DNA-binding protein